MIFRENNITRCDKWIEEWFSGKMGPDDYGKALFAGICWSIWKARCNYVFESTNVDAYGFVAEPMRLVRDHWEATDRRKCVEKTDEGNARLLNWQKPAWGAVTINVDAAFCNKSGKTAIGIVGRDWEGRFIGGIGKTVNAGSAFVAESLAMLEALNCRDIWEGDKMIMETDCQQLYSRVSGL